MESPALIIFSQAISGLVLFSLLQLLLQHL